jgi:hypothetical protein
MSIGTMFRFWSESTLDLPGGIASGTASENVAAAPAGRARAPSKPLKKTPTAG